MEILGNNLGAKKGKKGQVDYYCEKCDFKCFKKYSWDRHVLTSKHLQEIFVDDLGAKKGKKGQIEYSCEKCDKCFQTNAGLWKHKTKGKCVKIDSIIEENNEVIDLYKNTISNKDELIITLLKQNAELIKGQQDMMVKLSENGINNNHSNNTNHSHNKTFNLQFFLNETCKDAMNIMDFVDSIKLQLSDLEKVGKIGYVEGISSIIVKNLNSLDETKRPVHCTDAKREVMYVKDEDKWEKENENKQKIRKAIKHVAHKNTKMIKEYKTKHPDCEKSDSKFSDQYNKLIIEAMGGKGDNDLEKEDKIIKNIAKEVVIEK
jgi:hypothetical protein